jgi:hypothetical protein
MKTILRIQNAAFKKASALLVLGLWMIQCLHGAGVTIVTDGFQLTALDHDHGWVEAMGDYVADRASGTPYIYRLVVSYSSFTELVATLTPQNSGLPPIEQSQNPEIIIKLYWDQVAGVTPPADSTSIARIACQSLATLNHARELPIQIIGHSRGSSVASEMARFLGQQGIWVHQLTTLDPHPEPGIDAAVQIWDTVLFADNYYESYPYTFPAGANINGAFKENLTGRLTGGYGDDLSPFSSYNNHSDVHLWYHGTVNTSSGASDGVQTFTGTMRNTWYLSDEWGGVLAGFNFSRLGDGAGALDGLLDGYNDGGHNWFLYSRVNVTRSAYEWPSLTTLINNASGAVQAGTTFPVEFVYQSYDSGATVTAYLDTDQNPYNGNEIALTLPAINPQPSMRGHKFGFLPQGQVLLQPSHPFPHQHCRHHPRRSSSIFTARISRQRVIRTLPRSSSSTQPTSLMCARQFLSVPANCNTTSPFNQPSALGQ